MRIYGIYQADGGIVGELAYAYGKIRGTARCQLCDITHNLAWKKAEWKKMVERLETPIETIHLNERSREMRAFTEGETPCVLVEEDGAFRMLIDAEGLEACGGDVMEFENKLLAALEDPH